ncbi:Prolyl 4-hydroxylase subunit alpha-3 [Zalerion maritima]|uniref:Prolyl 4-hydroxylase subunit alpha-3 n=1 Tax=Zalerion maritima TaxID=339359 RepID=A0AAD5RQ72_9PEZI|nr:Prolyl 4-hydroxylase subunit alpha-3 [Zalerion maritima]
MATISKPTSSSSMPLGILIGAFLAILAMSIPSILPTIYEMALPPSRQSSSTSPPTSDPITTTATTAATDDLTANFTCPHHPYTAQIISLSPLVIYLQSFISPAEITGLLSLGEENFKPSNVKRSGTNQVYNSRTSTSALLPPGDQFVQCVLGRSREFMGTMFSTAENEGDEAMAEMGIAQLVRYVEGQKFDVHHDWFDGPQTTKPKAGSSGEEKKKKKGRKWNRNVSFFATLEDEDVEEGETWFPHVAPVEPQTVPTAAEREGADRDQRPLWRRHPDGGTAFRPVKGNAVFWVNLHQNGTGDDRTVHAGLPVKGAGRKTAMNIWPRKYFN